MAGNQSALPVHVVMSCRACICLKVFGNGDGDDWNGNSNSNSKHWWLVSSQTSDCETVLSLNSGAKTKHVSILVGCDWGPFIFVRQTTFPTLWQPRCSFLALTIPRKTSCQMLDSSEVSSVGVSLMRGRVSDSDQSHCDCQSQSQTE